MLNRPSENIDKNVSSTAKTKLVTNLKQVELWWVRTVSELAKVLGREVAQGWGKDSKYISKQDNSSSRELQTEITCQQICRTESWANFPGGTQDKNQEQLKEGVVYYNYNIAKGATGPRAEFILQFHTQINKSCHQPVVSPLAGVHLSEPG